MQDITIIVLEGLDGSGKSTQVNLLKDYFDNKSIEYLYLHFPIIDDYPYGELIGRFLRGEFGDVDSVHPQLVALLFALNRYSFLDILTNSSSKIILLDRYVYSNIAFQCSKLNSLEEKLKLQNWIVSFEFDYLKLPQPKLNIFLDVPVDFMMSNLTGMRQGACRNYLNGANDIHESSLNLQKNVANEYIRLSDEVDSFKRVICYDDNIILPVNVIHEKIIDLIKQIDIIG